MPKQVMDYLNRPIDESRRIGQKLHFERLVARELGHCLALREAGIAFDDVQVSWPLDQPLPSIEKALRTGLTTAIRTFGIKSYLEKRIFVLCARAYAEYLVVARHTNPNEADASGQTGWDLLIGTPGSIALYPSNDYSIACELATLYRSLDGTESRFDSEGLVEKVLGREMHRFMFNFGFASLGKLLTEVEFIDLLEKLVQREIEPNGDLANSRVYIDGEACANYSPGENTTRYGNAEETEEAEEAEAKGPSTDPRHGGVFARGISPSDRFLFAHELGHWLAATLLKVPTEGVIFHWEGDSRAHPGHGSCRVYLIKPAVTLGFDEYLKARIAILCAGPLADCSMQHLGKSGIGEDLYTTLTIGTGRDDYQKLQELLLVHRTLQSAAPAEGQAAVDQEPTRYEVLEGIVAILKDLSLWGIFQSNEYREFVNTVIESEQGLRRSEWGRQEKVSLHIPTDRLQGHLASCKGLLDLIASRASR